jgi:hypothetical protein
MDGMTINHIVSIAHGSYAVGIKGSGEIRATEPCLLRVFGNAIVKQRLHSRNDGLNKDSMLFLDII